MLKTEYDVIVVGAGPVGLLLTIELARRGVDVVLLEKSNEPGVGSKGKGIQPRTQEIFEQIGVCSELLAIGGEYPKFRIYQGNGSREEPYAVRVPATSDQPYPNILMVPQWQTEQVLRKLVDRLKAPVQMGCALTKLEQRADSVIASVQDASGARTLRAKYLVGCDGARSLVRRAVNVEFSGQTIPRRAIFADVRIDGLATDVWHRWPDAPGGQVSLCPLLGANLFQMAAEVPAEGDVDLSTAALKELLSTRLGETGLRVVDGTWSSLFRVNLRLADRYRVDRVFLAGDAAHVHPPTGGQGLNTGVQDAFNLGWKLATALQSGSTALLDTYESERRPIAGDMLVLSGALLGAWQEQRKTQRGALTSQLDLHYRDSVLSENLCPATDDTLSAGDRAPDAQLSSPKAGALRLFELLQHPGFTLLGYGTEHERLAAIAKGTNARVHAISASAHGTDAALCDSGDMQRAYGLQPGALIVIRPDGYIGARANTIEQSKLRTYLHRWAPAN